QHEHTHQYPADQVGPIEGICQQLLSMRDGNRDAHVAETPLQDLVFLNPVPEAQGVGCDYRRGGIIREPSKLLNHSYLVVLAHARNQSLLDAPADIIAPGGGPSSLMAIALFRFRGLEHAEPARAVRFRHLLE